MVTVDLFAFRIKFFGNLELFEDFEIIYESQVYVYQKGSYECICFMAKKEKVNGLYAITQMRQPTSSDGYNMVIAFEYVVSDLFNIYIIIILQLMQELMY